jgi:ribulose-phosphate 3-epimerase
MAHSPILIAPSLLAADFTRLGEEVRRAARAGADWLHVDIMDGRFVPNLTMGPVVVEGVRRETSLSLDVHLMIEDPEGFVEPFARAGASLLTFHIEAMAPAARRRAYRRIPGCPVPRGWWLPPADEPDRSIRARGRALIRRIRRLGCRPGLSLNPHTSVDWVLPFLEDVDLVLIMTIWPGFGGQEFIRSNLSKIRALGRAGHPGLHIEVDGGITPQTAVEVAAAGANTIVAGTSTFRAADMARAVAEIRDAAERGQASRAG